MKNAHIIRCAPALAAHVRLSLFDFVCKGIITAKYTMRIEILYFLYGLQFVSFKKKSIICFTYKSTVSILHLVEDYYL